MLKLLSYIILLFFCNLTYSQLITIPNKIIKGKKEGLWSASVFCHLIGLEGNFHYIINPEGDPILVVEGGYYENDKKAGFWKEYWVTQVFKNKK